MYLQDSRPITCHSATRCSPVASFFQTVRLVPSSRCLLGPGSAVLCFGHWPFLPFWWLAFWAFCVLAFLLFWPFFLSSAEWRDELSDFNTSCISYKSTSFNNWVDTTQPVRPLEHIRFTTPRFITITNRLQRENEKIRRPKQTKACKQRPRPRSTTKVRASEQNKSKASKDSPGPFSSGHTKIVDFAHFYWFGQFLLISGCTWQNLLISAAHGRGCP